MKIYESRPFEADDHRFPAGVLMGRYSHGRFEKGPDGFYRWQHFHPSFEKST